MWQLFIHSGKKKLVGTPKWYENIGIAYNGNAQNRFSFYDTLATYFPANC